MKNKLNFNNLIDDEIVSIELIGERDTIDIEVEDTHMFFANNIYTHNSAFDKERFGLDTISESLGKAQTADVIFGIGRTNEDKEQKIATLSILKNRNGEDGQAFILHFDTSKLDIRVKDNAVGTSVGMKGLNVEQQIKKSYA